MKNFLKKMWVWVILTLILGRLFPEAGLLISLVFFFFPLIWTSNESRKYKWKTTIWIAAGTLAIYVLAVFMDEL